MEYNPIDKDKTTENPGTIAYPHSVGSAVIKPEDIGKVKGRAMTAMQEQTNKQLAQIHEQIQTLAKQAKSIQDRVEVSTKIYDAQMGFEPLVGHLYCLYQRVDGEYFLSMLSPTEWGKSADKFHFVAQVQLLADHTWEVIGEADL